MSVLRVLYFFALSLGCALSIAVVSKTYTPTEVTIDAENNFEITFFTVDFDVDIYIGNTSVSDLSLEPANMMRMPVSLVSPSIKNTREKLGLRSGEGEAGDALPIAMVAQMGTANLVCPCTNCNNGDYPECDATQCTFTSDPANMGMNGPPRILIPAPARSDPLYVIFSVFAGKTADEIDAAPIPKRFIAGKITRFFDPHQSVWHNFVPPTMDISACSIQFLAAPTPLKYANGTDIGALTVSGFSEQAMKCNYTDFNEKATELLQAINTMDQATGKEALASAGWEVGSLLARDTWLGCNKLAKSLLTYEMVNETIEGDPRCYYDRSDPKWETDPCCNFKLSWSQCCAPKNITVLHRKAVDFDITQIALSCENPQPASLVLSQFATNLEKAELCTGQTKKRGAGLDVWDTMTAFIQTCHEEVFGTHGQAPVCKVDSDCWTSCNTDTETCIVPHDNPEPYLISCFAQNMNPEMERYLRKKWNLKALSSKEDFTAKFRAELTDPGCIGPTSWKYQGGWQQEQTDSCAQGEQECWCFTEGNITTCFRNTYVMPNQTGCLAEEKCNWDPSPAVTNTSCLAKTPAHYCGDCHGKQCWEWTQPAVCQTWAGPGENCTSMGLTSDPWNPWQCNIPGFTNESTCIPNDLCPSAPVGAGTKEVYSRWCGAVCYLENVTTSGDCSARANATIGRFTDWDSNTQTGAPFCRLQKWNRAECEAEGATWFSGRYYRDGILDTSPKCAEGVCSVNPWFTESECTAKQYCNMQCRTCIADDWSFGNLCFRTNVTSSQCQNTLGGQFADGICKFQWLTTRTDCENAGHTFESCDEMTSNLTACALCQEGDEACNITQNSVLKCRINNWGHCDTEEECQETGICDDWELQNWHSEYCRDQQNSASVNCTGACVFNFTTDFWGNPQCSGSYGWSRMGCILSNITDPEACESEGGKWKRKAYTRADCLAHGSACREKRFWQPTPKDNETCTACGGTYKPLYQWTPARWLSGTMRPLTWASREWGSINEWNSTVNWTKLNDVMAEVVAVSMRKDIKSDYLCKYTLVAANMKKIACDCGDVTGENCFADVTLAPVGEADLFSGIDNTYEWGKYKVVSTATSVSNETDSIPLTLLAITDLSFLANSVPAKRKAANRYGAGAEVDYYVVKSDDGTIYGQIVGTGASLDMGNTTGTIELCLPIDSSITVDPQFTIPDFATPRGNDSTNLEALLLSITISNGEMCADVNQSITYFPVYRSETAYVPPETAPSSSSAPPPSSGPSPSPPPPSSKKSTKSAVIVASVVSGAFVVGVTGVVVYLLVRKHDYDTLEQSKDY